jgi:hypothetical protein
MTDLPVDIADLKPGLVLWFVNEAIIEEPFSGTEYYISHGTITEVVERSSTYDKDGALIQGLYTVTFDNYHNSMYFYFGMMTVPRWNPECYLTEQDAIDAAQRKHVDQLENDQAELFAISKRIRYMKARAERAIIKVSFATGADNGRYLDGLKKAIKKANKS